MGSLASQPAPANCYITRRSSERREKRVGGFLCAEQLLLPFESSLAQAALSLLRRKRAQDERNAEHKTARSIIQWLTFGRLSVQITESRQSQCPQTRVRADFIANAGSRLAKAARLISTSWSHARLAKRVEDIDRRSSDLRERAKEWSLWRRKKRGPRISSKSESNQRGQIYYKLLLNFIYTACAIVNPHAQATRVGGLSELATTLLAPLR